MSLEVDLVDLLAGVDLGACSPLDFEDGERALVEGAEDGVIDQHVVARHFGVELDGRRAARRESAWSARSPGSACRLRTAPCRRSRRSRGSSTPGSGRRCRRTCARVSPVFALSALRPGERGLRAVEQHVGRRSRRWPSACRRADGPSRDTCRRCRSRPASRRTRGRPAAGPPAARRGSGRTCRWRRACRPARWRSDRRTGPG